MAHYILFFFVFVFFFFSAFAGADTCNVPNGNPRPSSTLALISANNPCYAAAEEEPLSWAQTVLRAQSDDKLRVDYLSSKAAAAGSGNNKLILQMATYVARVDIGGRRQKMLMAIDTSHDLSLVPCSDCSGCPEGTPRYSFRNSATARAVACSDKLCSNVTGGRSNKCSSPTAGCYFSSSYRSADFSAQIVQDDIVLGSDKIQRYTFGCIKSAGAGINIPSQGMLGLGRQSFSLLAQRPKLFKFTFSYCLQSYNTNHTGSLTLGPRNQRIYKNMKFTPLVGSSSLYSVNLTGFRFGRKVHTIPSSNGNKGIGNQAVIDSGTVFSVMEPQTYNALRNAIIQKMSKNKSARLSRLGGFDTCYNAPMNLKDVTLIFSGMDLTLPEENVIVKSSSGNIFCLAMSAARKGTSISVIGTYQQQNLRVLFDVPNSRLGVVPEKCI